ncbi:hypothetical protein SAMN05421749_103246 [Acinetobacter marinus]|uniref:Uncharacterized protein n=1 Tax=Acinetobacter marinus TaxID=281375 RepID=A0A1G6J5P8_9GAMM|nr:hypothetical protein [Acinetobacter marinus]SDC13949.1 hypothetical protein SAMN05421749_103246 [Acinetobacter marinus]
MNKLPDYHIIVTDIAGHQAQLFCLQLEAISTLKAKGFIEVKKYNGQGQLYHKNISDCSQSERLELITFLISIGALFSDGNGWSPAELVRYFKGQKLISDLFQVIGWKNSDTYEITIE